MSPHFHHPIDVGPDPAVWLPHVHFRSKAVLKHAEPVARVDGRVRDPLNINFYLSMTGIASNSLSRTQVDLRHCWLDLETRTK